MLKKIKKAFNDPRVSTFFACSGLLTFLSESQFSGIGAIVFTIYSVWTVSNLQQKLERSLLMHGKTPLTQEK